MSGMGHGCAEELKFASDVVPVVVVFWGVTQEFFLI